MLKLHPNILEKDGVKTFAVLPFDEFIKIQDALLDFEDLKDLRQAKAGEQNITGETLVSAKELWGLKD